MPKTRNPEGKVRPGTPVRAAMRANVWNGFVDAATAHRESRGGNAYAPPIELRRSDVVRVKNATGETRTSRDVVGFDNVLFDHDDNAAEFRDRPTLIAGRPDATKHRGGRWGIVVATIPDGGFGLAMVSGLITCRVHLVTPRDRSAGLIDGDFDKLRGGPGPARILWAPPDQVGAAWCVVSLGDAYLGGVLLFTTSEISPRTGTSPDDGAPGSGTCRIVHRTESGPFGVDNDGDDVSVGVYNWSTVRIPAERYAWGEVDARGDLWITSADCAQ